MHVSIVILSHTLPSYFKHHSCDLIVRERSLHLSIKHVVVDTLRRLVSMPTIDFRPHSSLDIFFFEVWLIFPVMQMGIEIQFYTNFLLLSLLLISMLNYFICYCVTLLYCTCLKTILYFLLTWHTYSMQRLLIPVAYSIFGHSSLIFTRDHAVMFTDEQTCP